MDDKSRRPTRGRAPLLNRLALAATLALLGPAALAQVSSMQALGNYSLDGDPATNLSSLYPVNDPVDVLLFPYSGTTTTNAGLHSYGSSSGSFGSRSSGFGVYAVDGGFKLVESITNSSAVAQSASFTFSITPGLLQNSIGSELGAGQFVEAGLKFDLQKNGSTVWDSKATLHSDSSGTTFSTGGDASLYAGGGTLYNVLGVSRTVDLGVINAGETIQLSYELSTFANGNSAAGPDRYVPPTTFTVPEGWYAYSQCGYGYGGYGGYGDGCGYLPPGSVIEIPGYTVPGSASGSHASSGDPFYIQLAPGITANGGFGQNFGEVLLEPAPVP
ncbi:hypothetical protein, partial [Pelomonas sp. KK5]|uniref:hypothetical protein n=1 Tax=Pelomonas sp. KK5 TaxID=1855730 RepID=UPI00097BFADD